MSGNSRPGPWPAGWRVAFRLARRDIRAHKGRSAIILVMIMLPVALMVGGLGLVETDRVGSAERPEATLGSAPAVLAYSSPVAVRQSPDASAKVFCDGGSASTGGQLESMVWEGEAADSAKPVDAGQCRTSLPVPGVDPAVGAPAPETAVEPLSRLVGAPVVPYTRDMAMLGPNYGYAPAAMLRGDVGRDVFRGMADLTSGRWPNAPGEVVVTGSGLAIGLPEQGTVDSEPLRAALGAQTVTVVGTATVPRGPLGKVDLVTALPPAGQPAPAFYLVDSDKPVPWSEVERLNTYGFVVLSRAVLDNPPHALDAVDGWSDDYGPTDYSSTEMMAAVTWTLILTLMLAASCLVAGPAFSVMAARQRRTLALVAANGGSAAQLRGTMLAQAVLLGFGAVVLGVVAGVAGVAAGTFVVERWFGGAFGPLDIPLGATLAVAAAGFVAALVSALVPARGLGRLEVVRSLAGEAVSRRSPLGQPLVGAGLLLLGTILCLLAVASPSSQSVLGDTGEVLSLGLGVAALIVGALLLVPSVLLLLGRIARGLPLPIRLAARDAARGRGRATSTVAAVMAGAIVLSGFGIAAAATDEFARRSYVPQAPAGHMLLHPSEVGSFAELRRDVESAVPGVTVREVSALTVPEGLPTEEAGDAVRGLPAPYAGLLRPGCDLDARPRLAFTAPCLVTMPGGTLTGILVADLDTARALFALSADDEAALRSGGALVFDTGETGAAGSDGTGGSVSVIDGAGNVTIVAGRVRDATELGEPQQWEKRPALHPLPARRIDSPAIRFDAYRALALITSETATRFDLQPTAPAYLAGPKDVSAGVLTDEQAEQVNRVVGSVIEARVERGYDGTDFGVVGLMLVVLVALLTLVATLTATALSMGEARRDMATVGAVGGSPGLRRRVAAWHAGGLGFIGTAVGLAVGAVPGGVYSLATSVSGPWSAQPVAYSESGIALSLEKLRLLATGDVAVPWNLLLIALVAVPLVAATFGALLSGGRVDLTRRMD